MSATEVMFSPTVLCLLGVFFSAGLHKNYWTGSHKTWMEDVHRIDPQIKEWIQDIFVSDSEEFGNLTFSLNFSGIKAKIEKKIRRI